MIKLFLSAEVAGNVSGLLRYLDQKQHRHFDPRLLSSPCLQKSKAPQEEAKKGKRGACNCSLSDIHSLVDT
ncbi:hypothetical protein ACFX13_048026 [Malus domestica]